MKYYIRTGHNGLPLDRFIRTFRNSLGSPFREITVPSCCAPAEIRSFISDPSFLGPTCTGGWLLYLEGVLIEPDPLVVIDITDLPSFVASMNLAYAGIFSFVIESGAFVITSILVPFTTFKLQPAWQCE